MPFLQLNIDVLQLIFDLLLQKDIKSLRLVNKAINSQVRLSIKRLFLSPNRINIDVFNAVLGHSTFKEQVQEIVWDDALLEFYEDCERSPLEFEYHEHPSEFKDFTDYASSVEEQENSIQTMFELRHKELWGDAEQLDIKDSFRMYRALYDEQESIIKVAEDLATFRRGLLELSNLKKVTLTSEAWRLYPLFPVYETPFFRSLKPGMKMPLPWPWLGEEDDIPIERLIERNVRLQEPWVESYEHWRGYNIMVTELLAATPHHNVKEFIIDVHREKTGISQQLFLAESASLSATEELFEALQLTRLDLALNMERFSQTDNYNIDHLGFWSKPWMKRVLSRLNNLTHFHLHLSPMLDYIDFNDMDAAPWIDMQRILPTPYHEAWPHLQHLGLANIITTEDSLYTLLSSLPALTDIDLDSVCLRIDESTVTYGPMKSLLDRVKASLMSVNTNDAAWRDRIQAPRWTIRSQYPDEPTRVTWYNDTIHDYLYGKGRNPFSIHEWETAWIVDDFDESAKVPHNNKLTHTKEQEQMAFRSLLLYPPPANVKVERVLRRRHRESE